MSSENLDSEISKARLRDRAQEEAQAADPFSPENLPILQFITTARILDVLMTLLTEKNPEAAEQLLNLHAEGNLIYTAPAFNGQFIADVVAELDDVEQNEN